MSFRLVFSSRLGALLLLCLGLFFACTGTDTGNPIVDGGTLDETETQLAGTLRDSLGNPLSQCQVAIRSLPGNNGNSSTTLRKVALRADSSTRTVLFTTDSSGEFQVDNLPVGAYVLVATAPSQGQGLLLRFSLNKRDTLRLGDSLKTQALQSISWPIPDSLENSTVYLPELGRTLQLSGDTLVLDSLPPGDYTLTDAAGNVVGQPSSQAATSPSTETTIPRNEETPSSSSTDSPSSSSVEPPSSSSTELPSSSSLETPVVNNSITDTRDNQVYGTVDMISRVWMAENLRFAGVDSTQCSIAESASTALAGCTTYGRFYTFDKAQSACPSGWHVPSVTEWSALFQEVGGANLAGAQLKSKMGWTGTGGLDSFGLNVLPVGSGTNNSLGTEAYFWTSTFDTIGFSSAIHITGTSSGASIVSAANGQQMSVRCVQDSYIEIGN